MKDANETPKRKNDSSNRLVVFDRARNENKPCCCLRSRFREWRRTGRCRPQGEVVPRGTGVNPRRKCTRPTISSRRARSSLLSPRTRLRLPCDVCFLNRASCFACRRPATASGSRDTRVAMLFDDRALTHTSPPAPSSSPDDHDAQVRGGRGAAAGGARRARSVAARGLRVGRVRARAERFAPREERVARCLRGHRRRWRFLGERRRGLMGRRRRRAG